MKKKNAKTTASEEQPIPKDGGEDTTAQDNGARPRTNPKSDSLQAIEDLFTGVAEKTFSDSPYWMESQLKPYNPDDLVRRTNDYSIYEDMINDDQVDSCLQIKRDLLLGSGSKIQQEESDNDTDEVKKDLEVALYEDPEVPIDDLIEEIYTACIYGFSLSEKIFKFRDDNTLTLNTIKTRHPSTWQIETDTKGNIQKYIQHGPKGDLEIDPNSLIHYVNNRRFGNPYGRSDLRSAYNAWFVKRQVLKWYAIFLEKAASPTPVAKYDKNANKAAIQDLHNAIKQLQVKTAMTIPKDVEIEFLESKSEGEAYVKSINILNMFIGRSMLIPDLLGFQGSETSGGSYALGKDQISILYKHILRRRTTVERLINKHIVWPIVVNNHGIIDKYPKFRFNPITEDTMIEFGKLFLDAIRWNAYKPSDQEINHFRSIVKFPQGEVERASPPVALDANGNPLPPQNGNQPDGTQNKDKGKTPGKEAVTPKGDTLPKEGQGTQDPGKKFSIHVYKKLPGEYDKKVDYEAIRSSMDRFKQMVSDESLPIVKRLFEDLGEKIKRKKIIQNQDAAKLEELNLASARDINLVLKRALRDGYKEGQATGRRELLKGNFRSPLPDDKFLEFLDSETFQFVGDWAYKVTQNARVKIMEAIRDGKPISAVLDILDEEGLPDAMTSLERYARTKFTDVMNRGRLASFEDSGVVAAYQFSAILDDRTSEICAGLHGKIFNAGDEPVPPMHFNCRSLLVPITKYEDYEADGEVAGEPIDSFIEQNKGDGFAKR